MFYYFSNRKSLSDYTGVIFSHFGAFADSAFAAITFGLASTTSASILKGIYVQQHFGDKVYFSSFDDIDIYSMLVVCIFLFGYSLFSCLKVLSYSLYLGSAEEACPVFDDENA
ncbi:hypothetical protein [Spongiibacter marinus]|uniref:hypothetical protein n=1 Tax=Spongiibacter marinus TaxID=354246 RepID=UPI0035BE75C0